MEMDLHKMPTLIKGTIFLQCEGPQNSKTAYESDKSACRLRLANDIGLENDRIAVQCSHTHSTYTYTTLPVTCNVRQGLPFKEKLNRPLFMVTCEGEKCFRHCVRNSQVKICLA